MKEVKHPLSFKKSHDHKDKTHKHTHTHILAARQNKEMKKKTKLHHGQEMQP